MRKISCICPTYNRQHFLEKSIKLFLLQTYPKKELIIVDDSPKPFVSELLKDKHIKYFHYKTRFPSIGAKRNECIRKSSGSIISHWDDDDFHNPLRLEKQAKKMDPDKLQFIVFDETMVYNVESRLLKRTKKETLKAMWYKGVVLSAMMYDKRIWHRVKFRNYNMQEDKYFLIDGMNHAGAKLIKMKNKNLFIYFKHPGSTWKFSIHNDSKWNFVHAF